MAAEAAERIPETGITPYQFRRRSISRPARCAVLWIFVSLSRAMICNYPPLPTLPVPATVQVAEFDRQ